MQETAEHPRLSLIAAVARNGAIGMRNRLIWQEPEDQRHFRRVTMGGPVIMGRKTWESLPERYRPLPGRRNLVLSAKSDRQATGAEQTGGERFASLDAALASLHEAGVASAFVIGGAQVYAAALPLADDLVLTEIDAELAGDTFFPAWDRALFEVVDRSEAKTSLDGTAYRFVTYRRRHRPPCHRTVIASS